MLVLSNITFSDDLNDNSDSVVTITQSSEINKGLTLFASLICFGLIIIIANRHRKHDDEKYPSEFELSNDSYSIQVDDYMTMSE